MEKIKIYKRKIDRHLEQVQQSGFQTANFNSLANIHSYLNGTVASFGRQSITKTLKKRAATSQSKEAATFAGASNARSRRKKSAKSSGNLATLQKAYKCIKNTMSTSRNSQF